MPASFAIKRLLNAFSPLLGLQCSGNDFLHLGIINGARCARTWSIDKVLIVSPLKTACATCRRWAKKRFFHAATSWLASPVAQSRTMPSTLGFLLLGFPALRYHQEFFFLVRFNRIVGTGLPIAIPQSNHTEHRFAMNFSLRTLAVL